MLTVYAAFSLWCQEQAASPALNTLLPLAWRQTSALALVCDHSGIGGGLWLSTGLIILWGRGPSIQPDIGSCKENHL